MNIDKIDLLKKGWSTEEINQASKIIEKAEDNKKGGIKFLDKSIFWGLLFILIISNVVCQIIILPFLFSINNLLVSIIVGIIGFVFGILFTIIISDIEKLERKHHRNLIITFFASGTITSAIIAKYAIDFSAKSKLILYNKPFTIGIIYLITFIIPYAVFLTINRKEKR